MDDITPAENNTGQNPPLIDALVAFVELINKQNHLSVSESGLLTRNGDGVFRRLQEGETLDGQPLYLSFNLPPITEVCRKTTPDYDDMLFKSVQKHVSGIERVWYKTHELMRQPVPQSHFDVQAVGDRIYISVDPILEQPEEALMAFKQFLGVTNRRGFLAAIVAAGSAGLGWDGVSRLKDPQGNVPQKAVGAVEVVAGGLAGMRVFNMGMKMAGDKMASVTAEKGILPDPIMDEHQWRKFVRLLKAQTEEHGRY